MACLQRRRKQFESGGGHVHYFRREAPEKFFRVPPHFCLVPPLRGGTGQKCGAHNVLTVILVIVNEERKIYLI